MMPMALPSREEDMAKAMAADAVIFGAVGGPKWASVPYEARPEAALLVVCARIWACLQTCVRLWYIRLWLTALPSKKELVEGLDILIVRELTGGVYFGEPKEIVTLEDGQKPRHRHPALYDERNRTHHPRCLRPCQDPLQPRGFCRKAQCDEIRPALEGSCHQAGRQGISRYPA